MTHSKRSKRKTNSLLPLAFIGAGLIILVIAAMIFIPKPEGSSPPESSAATTQPPTQPPRSGPSTVPVEVNFAAPALRLSDSNGNAMALEDYRGQVVLVNHWATWCPPCRAEMPELETYYQAHKNDGFILIGISAGDSAQDVNNFVAQNGLHFPMWIDLTGKAMQAFNIAGLPSSFVIDAAGTVRLAWAGAISLEMLEAYVTPLLEDK
ncbi:MAG: TlpA family protein disulfide reductase [Chloroflexi bacterium]|nr:TlpA family protein disulfide reductase [Chloroflexota bacterium]